VATVTLNQPATRTALPAELLAELIAAFESARDDDVVRCVVLTSSHETTFSSGANLAGFAADVPIVHRHLGASRLPAVVLWSLRPSAPDRPFSPAAIWAGFAAAVPIVHRHFGTSRFPELFRL